MKRARVYLHNVKSRDQLKRELAAETFDRSAASFYRYFAVEDPQAFRNELYLKWFPLGVFGRIYVAYEGINAQLSVPTPEWERFEQSLRQTKGLEEAFINRALTDGHQAFIKLDVKVRNKVVADGIEDPNFDASRSGQHLDPLTFNQKLSKDGAVVVDVRNVYECETGHFERSIVPTSELFSEVLPELKEKLQEHKDKDILLYCTGGIRCEKASAYLKHNGYENVFQLKGGIINYVRETKNKGVDSKFKGNLFVFDGRMAERAGEGIVSRCHQCGDPFDIHKDCANVECNELIIQCANCARAFDGCCSKGCQKRIVQY